MRIIAILIIGLLLASTIPSISLAQNNNTNNASENRGKGLDNAIQNVPSFVAEKLNYMRSLFSSGVRGIGQSLSDWIHSFFQPVIKNRTNTTGNETD